ncbi:hypothetical protein FS837_000083 [Tulasnella sp. UAMH 9824]|nr:hypothetical protein FS837_000083 [Tulasnella sp. UAMH 9824]
MTTPSRPRAVSAASPTSERMDPLSEDNDPYLSPVVEKTSIPGITAPVRWYDADRTEPYTHIKPFDAEHDTSVEFFFKPATLTVLAIALTFLAYVAITNDVLEEGREKSLLGIYASVSAFLVFSMVQFRDGPFIRPHPAFWRIILGINLLYELGLVYMLFEDLPTARKYLQMLDSSLNKPLPEKSYAEDCEFTFTNLYNAVDIFALAHFLGWLGKALILRDYWLCWILSILFELAEYSLEHQLANFKECWWDHWVLDVLCCNWLGLYIGLKICQFFEVKKFVWRGFRQSRGFKQKTSRVLKQMTPYDWTTFEWEGTASFSHYVTVVIMLAVFLAAELNPFYLKYLLWMEPDHPFVIGRLVGVFICALPAVRELYNYRNRPRKVARMGQHAWLLFATILTELLIIFKWSRGQFPEPAPFHVKLGWTIGSMFLIGYPLFKTHGDTYNGRS